jgi:hypothetical protein
MYETFVVGGIGLSMAIIIGSIFYGIVEPKEITKK